MVEGGVEQLGADGHSQDDAFAIEEGYVSVTPLRLDMTDYKAIVELENLFEQW